MGTPIKDEFAGMDLSRQRRYQLRRKAKGLCVQCGKPALPGMTACEPCHRLRYKRVQRYQGEPKAPRVNTKFSQVTGRALMPEGKANAAT